MKRLIAVTLAFIVLLSNVTALADDAERGWFTERGYPQSVVDRMDDQAKKELRSRDDLRFQAASLVCYSGMERQVSLVEGSGELSPIGGRGVTVLWVCSRADNGEVFVQVCYDWRPLPVLRGRDSLGTFWNENCFELKEGSFYRADKLTGVLLDDMQRVAVTYNDEVYSEGNQCETADGSLMWRAELYNRLGIIASELTGYAHFTLLPRDGKSEAWLSGGYLHRSLMTPATSRPVPDFSITVG